MNNSELVIEQLNKKLRDYIILKNIKIDNKDNIRCINPEHTDFHPSCHFFKTNENPEVELLYCFSCNSTFNLFHAAHYIEGLPIAGREFFNITLPVLCNYFCIEYKPEELSEDEREAYTRKRAFRDATNVIVSSGNVEDSIKEKLEQRGYSLEVAKNNYIGGIKSFRIYKESMISLGWTCEYLEKIDLLNKDIFHIDNLIFTIRNEYGEPVGFVSRRVPWDKNLSVPKFVNSYNSNIYQKGHLLYNLDRAKKIKKGKLWIVEGYPDVVTLDKEGINKVVGIGGIAFTDDHVELLNREEQYKLIICLDGDAEGIRATENTLEKLSKYKCFNVEVIEIPCNMDPDDYVKQYGVEKFKNLERLSPFEWMLKHSDSTGEQLVNKTIPIILEEKNYVTQLEMCKSLSKLSGIELYIIRKEVERQQNWSENEFLDKVENLKDRCIIRLQKEKTSFKTILYEIMRDHERIEKDHKNKIEEDQEYFDRYSNLKNIYITNPELLGFKLNNFPRLQKALDGIPKKQSLITIAGEPNSGKTSFLRYLSYDLITSNPDVTILFMTIDDNYEKTITPFVAIDQGLVIDQVKKPLFLNTEEEYAKFEKGWKNILELQKNRLIIRDVISGNDLDSLERHINKYISKFPENKLVVILDNFHKLGLSHKARREGIVDSSERIKTISNIYNLPVIMTVELRKMYNASAKPGLSDISESKQIEYDSDIVMLFHNDLHVRPSTFVKWNYNGMDMPYVEVNIAKNKESSYKGMIPYKFITTESKFIEVDRQEVIDLEKSNASINDMVQSANEYYTRKNNNR